MLFNATFNNISVVGVSFIGGRNRLCNSVYVRHEYDIIRKMERYGVNVHTFSVRIPLRRGVLDTTLCDEGCQ
jgi:hypothetical protein